VAFPVDAGSAQDAGYPGCSDRISRLIGTGSAASLSFGVQQNENKRQTKHVAACLDHFADRGSTPLTSRFRFAAQAGSEVCTAEASA